MCVSRQEVHTPSHLLACSDHAAHLVAASQIDEVAHVVQAHHDLRERWRVRARLRDQHAQQLQEEEEQALAELGQLRLDV
jgi:hypothetical protein